MDLYRTVSRGRYNTDFSFLNYNQNFPSPEIRDRNIVYRFRYKEFNGAYAKDKRLLAFVNNKETEIPYKVISMNYFKLMSNKIVDLIFNNECTIKTGDVERDKEVDKLVESVAWRNVIRKAVKLVTIYGDSCLKAYKGGVSAFSPLRCFKVVDRSDISKVKAYVLYEPIYKTVGNVEMLDCMRFEIHFKNRIFEIAKRYIGVGYTGTVGEGVELRYKNRIIPREGVWYETGVDDCPLVQWLTINQECDGVYGESVYADVQDVIFAMEHRLSVEASSLDSLAQPLLIVGMSAIDQDETGTYHLKTTEGKYLVVEDRTDANTVTPQAFQQDYKLDSSEQLLETFRSIFYELSEMGKTYLSGEYGGNISEETLNNTIKSAIDKGNRIITEVYYSIRDNLYCLCKLNGIDINKEDITITFNVGRTDDDKQVAEICKILVDSEILSKSTVRSKYFGYSEDQSIAEQEQIDKENGKKETLKEEILDNEN